MLGAKTLNNPIMTYVKGILMMYQAQVMCKTGNSETLRLAS
jgi:hypothetical protein